MLVAESADGEAVAGIRPLLVAARPGDNEEPPRAMGSAAADDAVFLPRAAERVGERGGAEREVGADREVQDVVHRSEFAETLST